MGAIAHADGEPSAWARRLWFGIIVAVALAPRMYRLSWGLPEYVFPDSYNYFIGPAAKMAGGKLIPGAFIHPPLLVYILSLLDLVWSSVTHQAIPAALKHKPDALYDLALLGRIACVAFATASVAVLYLLVRRLLGTRAGLLAAAAFALSPLHVLESHRANPDGPMIFFALVAAHQAVVAADRRSVKRLHVAFLFAGVAAATKYTGLAAVTVPVWVALCWTDATVSRRLRLCVTGGLLTTLVVAVALLPAAFAPNRFLWAMNVLIRTSYHTDSNLSAHGWLFSSYGRFVAVLAPYVMGWGVYLLALAGLGVLARNRRALGIFLAAVIPFLLVQGGAILAPPRWCLPVLPYFCLSAGAAMDRLWKYWPRIGIAAVVLTFGYTATLTGSQCLRLGLGPQRSLTSWLAERAHERHAAGRRLVVGYPSPILEKFDPLGPMLKSIPVRVVYSNALLRRLHPRRASRNPGESWSESSDIERQLDWLQEEELDFFILPSAVESHIPLKLGQYDFYSRLFDGSLGLHLVEDFRTTFFTERLYVWADQSLNTHWATGVNGYKIFARNDAQGGTGG